MPKQTVTTTHRMNTASTFDFRSENVATASPPTRYCSYMAVKQRRTLTPQNPYRSIAYDADRRLDPTPIYSHLARGTDPRALRPHPREQKLGRSRGGAGELQHPDFTLLGAELPSSSAPRIMIFSASSGCGRCGAFASSQGWIVGWFVCNRHNRITPPQTSNLSDLACRSASDPHADLQLPDLSCISP